MTFLVDHRKCGFIHLEVISINNLFLQYLVEWLQELTGRFEPAGDRILRYLHPQMPQLLYLAVKGEMIHILLEQDLSQETGTGKSLVYGQ
ncbi:hypothetical protein SDC9_70221 [bioreactor metagenome]|uniref:Uncharacterized protein n=1 Tax=bioreactor metagenome TaxID=1076179 RepID=A0A644Y6E8_9ZZZZ